MPPSSPSAERAMQANEIVTFGCRLNAFESEVIRRAAAEAGLERRGHRQHLRRHRRGRAAGAPGDPPGSPRSPRGADHRHRLRRRDRAGSVCRDARDRPGARQPGQAAAAELSFAPGRRSRISARARRIWSTGSRAGPAPIWQVQQGCDHRCTFCIIPYARGPSRSVPIGRIAEAGAPSGRRGLPRDRADRGRSDRLRRRSAGCAEPRGRWRAGCWPRSPSSIACASPRSTRSRSTPSCGG